MYNNDNVMNINGKEIVFKNKIDKILQFDGLNIVFLMENRIPSNNILAVDDKGNIIWNIKDIIGLKIDESYVSLSRINDNEIKVISASGIMWHINIFTRQITLKKITK